MDYRVETEYIYEDLDMYLDYCLLEPMEPHHPLVSSNCQEGLSNYHEKVKFFEEEEEVVVDKFVVVIVVFQDIRCSMYWRRQEKQLFLFKWLNVSITLMKTHNTAYALKI